MDSKIGVLVVAHGSKETSEWNKLVEKAVEDAEINLPTRIGFLMEEEGIRRAVESFEAEGVERIVAVLFFVSSYGGDQDEVRCILRLKPPKELELHHECQPIKGKVKIALTPGMDDHPLIAEILMERALELSRKPEDDGVFLIVHGTRSKRAASIVRDRMNSLATQIKSSGGFRDVKFGLTVEYPYSKEESTERIRELISHEKSKVEGSMIILPHFLSDGFFNRKEIPKIIEGLKCCLLYTSPSPRD